MCVCVMMMRKFVTDDIYSRRLKKSIKIYTSIFELIYNEKNVSVR